MLVEMAELVFGVFLVSNLKDYFIVDQPLNNSVVIDRHAHRRSLWRC